MLVTARSSVERGGGGSCDGCAGGRLGSYPGPSCKTAVTAGESWQPLHYGGNRTSDPLPSAHGVSPGINVCELWNGVHKVLVPITGGFHLLFYLRQEGNNASCIRLNEFELFYYLVLMKAEQMG